MFCIVPCYYGWIRLLINRKDSLVYKTLYLPYPFTLGSLPLETGNLWDLPGIRNILRWLAAPFDSGGTSSFLPYRMICTVCFKEEWIDFHSILLTKLNSFTPVVFNWHYGSPTLLTTLKPNVTASAPSLELAVGLTLLGWKLHPTIYYASNWRTSVVKL